MALEQILKSKIQEVQRSKAEIPLRMLESQLAMQNRKTKSMFRALKTRTHRPHLICEIKKASPSEGVIRSNFDPESIADSFNSAGATAISVLTDSKYFQGSKEILKAVRARTSLPILRKDFLIDPYQVVESKLIGADCILLIVAALKKATLRTLFKLASDYGLESLVEVHNEKELEIALNLRPQIIGINNRNLQNLKVDVSYAQSLLGKIPNSIARIVESGINSRADIRRYDLFNVDGFLVGTSIMKSRNIERKIRSFFKTP